MPTVLTISLGPVQDFIAAARKTRDLWAGSAMLSAIARAAACALREDATLIFPTEQALHDEHAGVANKIVALVHPGVDPAKVADIAKQAARSELARYGDAMRGQLRQAGVEALVNGELVDRQLDHFLEWYAAWANDVRYDEARRQADALLVGRKALRDFAPASGIDGIPKSSLDGGREAVLNTKALSRKQQIRLGIKHGELLDGISLIKRLAERVRFVSTARVAADPMIRYWQQHDPSRLDELCRLMPEAIVRGLAQPFSVDDFPQYAAFPYDTQLLQTPSIDSDDYDDEYFAGIVHRKAQCGKASSYLAVLMADGDHMGDAISSLRIPEDHQRLSDALVHFANEAGRIVAMQQGALIYSGGDDVLAFLPLDTALSCAQALRQAFVAALAPLHLEHPPTLSVGVSISHFSSHLQSQLDWARETERAAKAHERNTLAVAARTRGGGDTPVTAAHYWHDNLVRDLWHPRVAMFRDGQTPVGLAYELRLLAEEMAGVPACAGAIPGEVQRIVHRKRQQDGDKLTAASAATLTANSIDELTALIDELLIARRLAKEVKL